MFKNLEAELKRNNLRRKDLAEALKLNIGTISQKLNGKAPITLNEAKMIKELLNAEISLEELFKDKEFNKQF